MSLRVEKTIIAGGGQYLYVFSLDALRQISERTSVNDPANQISSNQGPSLGIYLNHCSKRRIGSYIQVLQNYDSLSSPT